jgi:AraC-like DNA-binding protein
MSGCNKPHRHAVILIALVLRKRMKTLRTGETFWNKQTTVKLDGTILTGVEYTPNIKELPWHYHENAYFFMHLRGQLLEVNRKGSKLCQAGTLLFHYWQDAHYDTSFTEDASFFHIELEKKWFERMQLKSNLIEGSFHFENPVLKPIFYKIYNELQNTDYFSQLTVDGLLAQAFSILLRQKSYEKTENPQWTKKIREILNDNCSQNASLKHLSDETGLHPVYLSSEFAKYFGVSFGEYLRRIKLEKARMMLLDTTRSITEIAYNNGFADQSHFIRNFKEVFGTTPLKFRKAHRKGL